MRITTFRHAHGTGWGLVEGDGIVDLSDDPSLPYADASEALKSETVMDLAMAACGVPAQHRLEDVTLLAPLPTPGRVLVVGDGQIAELHRPKIRDAGVVLINGARMLAVIIGSPTSQVARGRAMEHILGTTDAFVSGDTIALGPWAMTRDEAGDLDVQHDAGRVVADVVADASVSWTLAPGDLILLPAWQSPWSVASAASAFV